VLTGPLILPTFLRDRCRLCGFGSTMVRSLFIAAVAAAASLSASAASLTSQAPTKSLEEERQALKQWSSKVSAGLGRWAWVGGMRLVQSEGLGPCVCMHMCRQ